MKIIKRYIIYKISEPIENKYYIGKSTIPIYLRMQIHKSGNKLKADKHFKKIGWHHCKVDIIETCDDDNILEKERQIISRAYQEDKDNILNIYNIKRFKEIKM